MIRSKSNPGGPEVERLSKEYNRREQRKLGPFLQRAVSDSPGLVLDLRRIVSMFGWLNAAFQWRRVLGHGDRLWMFSAGKAKVSERSDWFIIRKLLTTSVLNARRLGRSHNRL